MQLPSCETTLDLSNDDAQALRESLIEIFGQHIMSLRNQRLAVTAECCSDPTKAGTGRIQRQEYEDIADLSTDERTKSLALVKKVLDAFIDDVLHLFGHQGYSLLLNDEFCLRYDVLMQVLKIKDEKDDDPQNTEYGVLESQALLVQEADAFFPDYARKWRSRFADHI